MIILSCREIRFKSILLHVLKMSSYGLSYKFCIFWPKLYQSDIVQKKCFVMLIRKFIGTLIWSWYDRENNLLLHLTWSVMYSWSILSSLYVHICEGCFKNHLVCCKNMLWVTIVTRSWLFLFLAYYLDLLQKFGPLVWKYEYHWSVEFVGVSSPGSSLALPTGPRPALCQAGREI